jgi:hypothetical protein
MPFITFAAFDGPDAADLNRYPVQIASAIKTVDESVSGTTTLQDDNELFVDVLANTTYWILALVIYAAATTRDLRMGFNGPSGCSINWVSDAFSSGLPAGNLVDEVSRTLQTLASAPSPGGNGTAPSVGNNLFCVPRGIFTTGANAGTLNFQWAQASAGTPATIVRADSVLLVRRLTI